MRGLPTPEQVLEFLRTMDSRPQKAQILRDRFEVSRERKGDFILLLRKMQMDGLLKKVSGNRYVPDTRSPSRKQAPKGSGDFGAYREVPTLGSGD